MRSEVEIRNKELSVTCPRRAFLQSEIPGGIQKYRGLSKVFHHIVDALSMAPTRDEIIAQIQSEFDAAKNELQLLNFEERAEKNKMFKLLTRYYYWEAEQLKNLILDKNFKVVVSFDGEDTEVKVDRLIDRGEYYEAITYAYKRPDLKNRGRKFETNPEKSIRLLLLYRAGMKKLDQLQKIHGEAVIPVKEVYGSMFYMRSTHDSGNTLQQFDEHGDQVVSYSFTHDKAAAIETAYHKVNADVNKQTCKPTDCNSCPCFDLCKTEFVAKKKVTIPPPEIKPINEIKLTKTQQEFVEFTNGECRVNAVAGSGKTTIITLRTINLLELGVLPREILMVTFTDKACGEMRERIQRYISGTALNNLHLNLDDLTIETFNSWGQNLLNTHFDKLGFTQPPVIIDDIQRKDIIIDILQNHQKLPLNYYEPFLNTVMAMGAVTEIGRLLDTMKAAHVSSTQEIEGLPKLKSTLKKHAAELFDIYNEYNAKLVELNVIDYEDQLRLVLKLKQFGVFKSLPYKHIVVDEFQDSNSNQIDLIREIMEENPKIESLAVVGDEMQASAMRFCVKSTDTV